MIFNPKEKSLKCQTKGCETHRLQDRPTKTLKSNLCPFKFRTTRIVPFIRMEKETGQITADSTKRETPKRKPKTSAK
jgi:hypothetical protein